MAETLENITQKNWVNPYVDKIGYFTDYILPCAENGPSTAETSRLRTLLPTFTKSYIEIGSGSGGFLLQKAARDLTALFVGFELRFKRIVRTAEKARLLQLQNILLFKTKGERINDLYPDSSVDGVFLNFPEPWTKRKWFKHRVVSDKLLIDMHRILKPGGFFALKTDNAQYYTYTKQQLLASPLFTVQRFSTDLYTEPYFAENIQTEFEQLFRSQGLPIYFLEVTRCPASVLNAAPGKAS